MKKETEFNLSRKMYTKIHSDNTECFQLFDVKEFIKREINRKQREIDILINENSGESISKAEEFEKELNKFKKDAGDKLT